MTFGLRGDAVDRASGSDALADGCGCAVTVVPASRGTSVNCVAGFGGGACVLPDDPHIYAASFSRT
jgi:hypothetical protein